MTYNLPEDYIPRLNPQYFHDTLTDSRLWQSDVYRAAAQLARKIGVKRLVDIGCGTAGKLMQYANQFQVVGIDYGDNLKQCSEAYPQGEWYDVDLQAEVVPADIFRGSVALCADVIEHLVYPDTLIETLRNASKMAAYVLVSTPDRERLYNSYQNGPPDNKAHVQEWTLAELEEWFIDEGLPVKWAGWTISYLPQMEKKNTSLIILSKEHEITDFPLAFEEREK